jgi:LL-diaminopimelate aminotransferase
MLKRNPGVANINDDYLFPRIAKRQREYEDAHPGARIISLGIGNVTEPIMPHIASGLTEGARKLGTANGNSGYQGEGLPVLREKISQVFYGGMFSADEIFISDGAKCDIGRLQLLFGSQTSAAIQDPSYPVYADGSVLINAAGKWNGSGYEGIAYLPCTAENGFFPDLSGLPDNCLIYFCSPNNPTGAVSTHEQLKALVIAAQKTGSIIIFDAAYSQYIRDDSLPKSIFEIEGAKTCAIEVNSFSKSAGFTGVRLGWTAVPSELKYSGGESVKADWARISGTVFNGASSISQAGGLAALDGEGILEMRSLTDFFLENAALIRTALEKKGVTCSGGDNSPYIWAYFPDRDSWDVFSEILEKYRVITTPGSGFGPAGRSFIRLSAFGGRADVREACERLAKWDC